MQPLQDPAAGGLPAVSTTAPVQNETLDQLHDTADALLTIVQKTSDLPTYRAANSEYAAVQDRISTLLNLNLAKETAAMNACSAPIIQAKTQLDAALKNVASASDVINGVAKFLGAVDSLITAAKVAASLIV